MTFGVPGVDEVPVGVVDVVRDALRYVETVFDVAGDALGVADDHRTASPMPATYTSSGRRRDAQRISPGSPRWTPLQCRSRCRASPRQPSPPQGPTHVYSTHLDYRPDPALRRTQVDDTIRILDKDQPGSRQLLLGDSNACPGAPELAPLPAHMRDGWAAANGPDGGLTYPASTPQNRIDYVTFAGQLRATLAEVPDTQAPDHRPVVATITR